MSIFIFRSSFDTGEVGLLKNFCITLDRLTRSNFSIIWADSPYSQTVISEDLSQLFERINCDLLISLFLEILQPASQSPLLRPIMIGGVSLTFKLMTGASLIEFDWSVIFPRETGASNPAVIEMYDSLAFGGCCGTGKDG